MVGRARATRPKVERHELALRPRAITEIRAASDHYAKVGHDQTFLHEIDRVLEAVAVMPLRFPVVITPHVHRALVRRYPYAVFFRIRRRTSTVVVLAVLHQRMSPARWPR